MLIRRHWRVLLYGLLLCWGTFPGQTFFFSLFNQAIRSEFDLSHGDFGFYYLVATLLSALTLSVVGAWIDRTTLRFWSLAVIGLLLGAGVVFALAPNLLILTLGIYLLRLSGQGLLSHTAITAMGRYFISWRGRALALVALGYPLAESILPFLVPLLLAFMDWRQAWLVLLGMVALILLPATYSLLGRTRVFGELAERQAEVGPGQRSGVETGLSRRQMLRQGSFYLLAPMVVMPSFLITGWFFHHQHVAAEYGWQLTHFALAFSAYAAAAVLFSLVCGVLTDRFGAQRLLWLPLLPLAACNLPLLFAAPVWAGWSSFFLMGLCNGATGTIIGAAWAELYGTRHLGAIKALATALMVFGSALAPFAMGSLFDAGFAVATVAGLGLLLVGLAAGCGVILSRLGPAKAADAG